MVIKSFTYRQLVKNVNTLFKYIKILSPSLYQLPRLKVRNSLNNEYKSKENHNSDNNTYWFSNGGPPYLALAVPLRLL